MNCTKCGKEIPDGKELCDDCEKKLNEETKSTAKESKKTTKKETKKDTKKTTEKKSKEKKKDEKKVAVKEDKKETAKDSKENSKITVIVAVCAIVILIGIIIFAIVNRSSNAIGNTIGNIRNYGYAAIKGNTIYYLSPNEDSSKVGIFKAKKDGSNIKELYMSDLDIISINVKGNYIYFIGVGSEAFSETDETDNKIYRMKTDGSDLETINDNEFSNDCYEIYVINNNIYYIGTDNHVYKMDLKGGNRSLVTEDGVGYLGITDKYIIYNKLESEDATDYVTYISKLDGSDAQPIIKDTRLYSVNIEGDYVVYTTSDKYIYKTKIGSGVAEALYEVEAYNLNTSGKYAYYLNYKDAANDDYTVCVFKVGIDEHTETPILVKELESYSSFIDIVGENVIYMDSNDTSGFINLVKLDGSGDTVSLYNLNYEEYYNASENATYSDTDESSSTTTDTNNVEPEVTEEEEAAIVANEVAAQQQ